MSSIAKALVTFSFTCLVATSAMADYQSGVNAYTTGDFDRALAEWQKVIESPAADVHPFERAETFYAVAMLFWMGQGVNQDTSTSAGFLRQAAELNHPGAQSKLGYLFLIGQGVTASTFEAMKWLEMAAKQGDTDAQYNLAVMYRDGIGVEVNPDLAMQWFQEAAANGDPVSAEVLADYERRGSLQAETRPEQRVAGDGVTDAPRARNEPNTLASSELAPEPEPEVASTERERVPASPGIVEPSISGVHDEQWILTRDPARYTIQVIALKNLQSMNRLIEQHPQLAPFALYVQGEPGSPLYVLVQGDYSNLDEVRDVQKNFPSSLTRPDQLWVRRFSRVQELIANRQQAKGEITEISRAKD